MQIIKYSKLWFTLSGLLCLLSVGALAVWGLNLSIDFTGGTLMSVQTTAQPTATDIAQHIQEAEDKVNAIVASGEAPAEVIPAPSTEESLRDRISGNDDTQESAIQPPKTAVDLGDPLVVPAQDNTYTIKLRATDEYTHQIILSELRAAYPDLTEQKFETIGPVIGSTLREKALWALGISLAAIILYIAFAFRKVPKRIKPWKFGVVAVIALFHDILIVCGVFALLGAFLQVEVGTLFVTALLTILGYSVNDTIVVFDRLRENLKHQKKGEDFGDTADLSMNQTMARSINTSLTVLLVLAALFFLGDEAIKWFVFALIIGTIVGTYSSIFLASPLLVAWAPGHSKKK